MNVRYRRTMRLAGLLIALASLLALHGRANDGHGERPWSRARHEQLAERVLAELGAAPRRDCSAEPAFVDHFGTPLCASLPEAFELIVRPLRRILEASANVTIHRIHASAREAYIDLRVDGVQHLLDFALEPDARGEYELMWFIPDVAREPGP